MTIVLRCPWDSPPLRSNDRHHWAKKAKITREIRKAAYIATVNLPADAYPFTSPVVVTLVWTVTDKRRRDVGASGPTLKAWIDGIVDAGFLNRDDHAVVAEERLRIEVGEHKGVRVEIEAA